MTDPAKESTPTPLVLFDGPCDLCRRSVRFVIKHEKDEKLRFASLQSYTGRAMIDRHGLPDDLDAMVLVEDGGAKTGSDAAIALSRHLTLPWRLFHLFRFTPPPLHRAVYRWIARNRDRWFGREGNCPLPDPEDEPRFVDL